MPLKITSVLESGDPKKIASQICEEKGLNGVGEKMVALLFARSFLASEYWWRIETCEIGDANLTNLVDVERISHISAMRERTGNSARTYYQALTGSRPVVIQIVTTEVNVGEAKRTT